MFCHSFHGVVYIMDSSTLYELVPFPTFSVNKGSNVCCSFQARERERELKLWHWISYRSQFLAFFAYWCILKSFKRRIRSHFIILM